MRAERASAASRGGFALKRNVSAILAASTLLCAAASHCAETFARFSFDQRYLAIPGRYTKDRCFVKRGGEWHCFMIAGNDSAMDWRVPGNEVSFAHASTRDFRHWTMHPDVLGIGTGAWDERNIWAPDIVPWGDGYRMYYTGVDSSVAQRMGMAESSNLFEWIAYPSNPIYRPDTALFDWGEGRWSNCRDPDVFRFSDTLHVLLTATTRDGLGAVDHAVSTDGVAWIDRGPLFVNDSWPVLESVQLVEREGRWYLFFNEHGVLGISVVRAESMYGPWRKETRTVVALGQAQEIFGDLPNTLIARHKSYLAGGVYRNVMKIDSLFWDDDGDPHIGEDAAFFEEWSPVDLDDPDPGFGETGGAIFSTDSAFAYQPTFGENPSFRGEPVTVGVVGNSWIGTRERYRGPLTPTEEGGLVGDGAVGGVRSRDFRMAGTEISFLIGGTEDPARIFLALCDSRSHEIIMRETGTGSEALEPRLWRTDSLYGREVYLKIVDASPDGHLNLDEIAERVAPQPVADLPFPGFLFPPYPNPFNAASTVVLRLDRDSRVGADVCGAAGNRIRTVFSGSLRTGFRRFQWDGTDDSGRAAASGVYFFRVEADGRVRSRKFVLVR